MSTVTNQYFSLDVNKDSDDNDTALMMVVAHEGDCGHGDLN